MSSLPRLRSFINETAKLLKSLSIIFGVLTAVYLAIVNFFSDVSFLDWYKNIGDVLVIGSDPSRLSSRYVFYSNQDPQAPGYAILWKFDGESDNYEDVKVGDTFVLHRSVNVYSGPSTESTFVEAVEPGFCFTVVSEPSNQIAPSIASTESAGWLEVSYYFCNEFGA